MLHSKINVQVTKLINYFQGQCDIFIHIDKDCVLTNKELSDVKKMPGVVDVYQKYHVNWGGFNILRTEMFMLEKAMEKSDFKYVHMLSGNDYPIKPLSYFLNFFNNAIHEYISCMHMPNPRTDDNTFIRFQNYYFPDFFVVKKDDDVAKLWNIGKKLAKFGIRRKIPDQFPHLYDGSQWFSLSRQCIDNLLQYTAKHPSFYQHMRFGFAPEEIYINTFVMNSIPQEKIGNDNLRYIRWPFQNAQHPKTLTENDFIDLAFTDAMFARKINMETSAKLIEKIDKLLLKEEEPSFLNDGQSEQSVIWNNTADEGLLGAIVHLCKLLGVRDVVDLGCGTGYYVFKLRREKILARGFDGNPNTLQISDSICSSKYPCSILDLHHPIKGENIADMTLLINVGEYIPSKYQSIVFDNVCKLSKKYVIISWISPDQLKKTCKEKVSVHPILEEEYKHIVNPMEEIGLIGEFGRRGYCKDLLMTDFLQKNVYNSIHSNIICFRKENSIN